MILWQAEVIHWWYSHRPCRGMAVLSEGVVLSREVVHWWCSDRPCRGMVVALIFFICWLWLLGTEPKFVSALLAFLLVTCLTHCVLLVFTILTTLSGPCIAHAVSRRFPATVARFRAQVRSHGICGRRSGTEAGFLRVLRFRLPILIPPTAPHSSSVIRPVSGRPTKWNHSHRTPKNLKEN
jgi:hypothetical protein